MRVLGIESSCDETGAAIVDETGRVFADVVASQINDHARFGGIVPEVAARAHLRSIVPVIEEALRVSEMSMESIDAIAVTQGPGLIGSLLIGLQTAKAFAFARSLPLVGVNHLDGHLLAVYLQRGATPVRVPTMPYVALLVSGGHTALYVVVSPNESELLGQTRDDAAGEAFDKVAKLIGLGYPGGPIVDRLAAKGESTAIRFPVPMTKTRSLEFSFSGIKTAVAQHVRTHGAPTTDRERENLCASFQRVVVESLVRKAIDACRLTNLPRLVITGGVAANRGLRARAADACRAQGIELFVPEFASCTDNAAMIAYAGAQRLVHNERDTWDLAAFSRDPQRRRGKFASVRR